MTLTVTVTATLREQEVSASVTVNVEAPASHGLAADLRHALGSARTEMGKIGSEIAERM